MMFYPKTLLNGFFAVLIIITLTACGGGDNSSSNSGDDITPPSVPDNLIATAVSSTQISLNWSASTDNVEVTGYRVYREGTEITTATGTNYSNRGLTASTTYSYTVIAYDAAGNDSAQSSSVSVETPPPQSGDVPNIDVFITRMTEYGNQLGIRLETSTNNDDIFYDAQRVLYQIAEYLGETEPWYTYARYAGNVYRNSYLIPTNFGPSGWMRFPHGLYLDWSITGNETARTDLITMRDRGTVYNPDTSSFASSWYEQQYSRPVAYNLENNLMAERAGEPRNTARVPLFIEMALGHIEQWVTGIYLDPEPAYQHVQPFMTGLTASALIEYYERSVELGDPDTRIPAAIKRLDDWLWDNTWVADVGGHPGAFNDLGGSGYGAFRQKVPQDPMPAPMLNQLIVPSYAWLYKHTCDVSYKQKADLIFKGGVMLISNLTRGKFFNQNHRAVFDYLVWRQEGDDTC